MGIYLTQKKTNKQNEFMQLHLQKKCYSFPKPVGSNCCKPCPWLFIC